jgi:hypothetical protein
MQGLRSIGIAYFRGFWWLVRMASKSLAWEQAAQPASQSAGVVPSAQGGVADHRLGPQCQVVYETVQPVECVQVPVRTCGRTGTEYRTETVPVTRLVPETVNESRTVTVCVPKQQTIKQPVTRVVCEPVTTVKRYHRAIPVTKNVEKVVHQAYCTTVMKTKVVSRMVPQCFTEMVPVTRMRKVVESEVQRHAESTGEVKNLVSCVHRCGHQCGGGCGCAEGSRPVSAIAPSPLASTSSRHHPPPVVRHVPETITVPRQRDFVPVKETIRSPGEGQTRPVAVRRVTAVEFQPDVTRTQIVPRRSRTVRAPSRPWCPE